MKWPWQDEPLSDEQRLALIEALLRRPCVHCGGVHSTACPRVRAVKFTNDGKTPIEVEFWAWDDVDWGDTIWLVDLKPTMDEIETIKAKPLPDDPVAAMWEMFSRQAALSAMQQGAVIAR